MCQPSLRWPFLSVTSPEMRLGPCFVKPARSHPTSAIDRFAHPSWFICSGVVILCGVTLPYLTFTMKREPITWVLSVIW